MKESKFQTVPAYFLTKVLLSLFLFLLFFIMACSDERKNSALATNIVDSQYDSISRYDQVHQNQLTEVRLGDGVPLNLDISIRWKIEDAPLFLNQFESPLSFNQAILKPRSLELSKMVSNAYTSVDSVFSTYRNGYISAIKRTLMEDLKEEGIVIKEIILSNIHFPKSFTDAMEKTGLKQQELERIREQNMIDVAQAAANKKKATADGEIAIAKAEAEGRLQKLKAKTEESRRKSELAKAETQNQVENMKARAEGEKRKLLAKVELEQKRDLKDLEMQKQREVDQIAFQKQKDLNQFEFAQQVEFAKLCTENPVYASFLVNKELASKVNIAVLPAGGDPTAFGNMLKTTIPTVN